MGTLKNINKFRKHLTRSLTKNIGHKKNVSSGPTPDIEIKRILICRPNKRLGNLLLFTPLLQEVESTFPGCKIDLFVKGNLASSVFKNYENINRIIHQPVKPFEHLLKEMQGWLFIKQNHYDLAINVINHSSSGRLSTQFANSTYKFFGDVNEDELLNDTDKQHAAKLSVYALRNYLEQLGFPKNNNPVPKLNLRLSNSEIAEGKEILNKIVNNEKKTICLFTYATGDKCYSEEWWGSFYERLKTEYANYNIIEILPVQNVSKISFKAPTFSDKDIRKVGALIANTEVFICADGGIMHLASSVNTPTVGLFSVTDKNTFQPYNDKSVGVKTNETDINELIKILKNILNTN